MVVCSVSGAAPGKIWVAGRNSHFWGWSHVEISSPTSQAPELGWPEGSAGTVGWTLTCACSIRLRIITVWLQAPRAVLWKEIPRELAFQESLMEAACFSGTCMPWKSHSIISSVICRSKQSQACLIQKEATEPGSPDRRNVKEFGAIFLYPQYSLCTFCAALCNSITHYCISLLPTWLWAHASPILFLIF